MKHENNNQNEVQTEAQNEIQTQNQIEVQNTNEMSFEEFSKTIWDKHTVGIFDSRGNRDEFKKIVNIKSKDNVDGSNIYAKSGSAAKYWLNYFDGNTEWLNDIDKIFIALGVNAPWDYENMEKLLDKILAEKESSAKVMILENYPTTFPNSSRENAEKNQKQFDEYHEKLKQYADAHPDVFFIETLRYPNNLLLENGQMENCSDGLHVDAWTDAGKETLRKFVDNINHATYEAYKEAGLLNKQVSLDTQGKSKKSGIKVVVNITPDNKFQIISPDSNGYPLFEQALPICANPDSNKKVIKLHLAGENLVWASCDSVYGGKNIAIATPEKIAEMGWEEFENSLDQMKAQQDLKVKAVLSELKYANGMFKAYTEECDKLSYLLAQMKEEQDSKVRTVLSQLDRNTDGDRG